jgi:hypothetical protein
MLTLYRLIERQLEASAKLWNNRFFAVEIADGDMAEAGAERSKPFNVVNTLKKICTDFNVPVKEAWQVQYALVQTSTLSDATNSKIQDDLRIIKERNMKMKQKK